MMAALAEDVAVTPGINRAQETEVVIELKELRFSWPRSSRPTLDIAELRVHREEHLFIAGPSGSGKSTLLGLLGGVIKPQLGSVAILGNDITAMGGAACDRFRADHIGFIFQMFNLIPYLSVIDNVILPCRFSARRKQNAQRISGSMEQEALRLLGHLDLQEEKLLRKPVLELSVGQQQRVAAARALIGSPEIIIADEPTSALDNDLRENFIRLLFRECADSGTTVVFVSHDTSLAPLFDRTLPLREINMASGATERGAA